MVHWCTALSKFYNKAKQGKYMNDVQVTKWSQKVYNGINNSVQRAPINVIKKILHN